MLTADRQIALCPVRLISGNAGKNRRTVSTQTVHPRAAILRGKLTLFNGALDVQVLALLEPEGDGRQIPTKSSNDYKRGSATVVGRALAPTSPGAS